MDKVVYLSTAIVALILWSGHIPLQFIAGLVILIAARWAIEAVYRMGKADGLRMAADTLDEPTPDLPPDHLPSGVAEPQ